MAAGRSAGAGRTRERRFELFRKGARNQGVPARRAKEIAARAVRRAPASADGGAPEEVLPPGAGAEQAPGAGADRAARQQPGGPTRDELYDEARQRGVRGRSRMTKRQLRRALGR
ncbi:plasmid stabilization protein [Streptomyces cacaoi]|uniref:Plasmid stabilization protein n=1 Tax=Streptomyces cacaoi TaxID=1898 RepID=A0A4Y3QRD2_STRCI|nr:plasmid stabilization protein [Streptomyces cacaoi]GEB47489.1 hypothetical protein SCA03_00400 [Streptomyces cacaoi]